MIILKENEACPYDQSCPYNKEHTCFGGRSDRRNIFTCDYVNQQGQFIADGQQRHPMDQTGRMQVLMEA